MKFLCSLLRSTAILRMLFLAFGSPIIAILTKWLFLKEWILLFFCWLVFETLEVLHPILLVLLGIIIRCCLLIFLHVHWSYHLIVWLFCLFTQCCIVIRWFVLIFPITATIPTFIINDIQIFLNCFLNFFFRN
jgi:hypothetical protein